MFFEKLKRLLNDEKSYVSGVAKGAIRQIKEEIREETTNEEVLDF